MLIWAWIFGVPFVVAAINLAATVRSHSGSVRYASDGPRRLGSATT